MLAPTSVVIAVVIAYFCGWFAGSKPQNPAISPPDLSIDPVYSKYKFGRDDSVIDIGVQPIWIPTNIISETMKRDRTLIAALAEDGLTVRFHGFRKGADVNFFLARGDLEAGVGGDMPALSAVAKSNVLVAAVIQRGSCSLVASRQMLTTDLAGLRIAYPFGSVSHYRLLRLISSIGLKESDADLVAMDVSAMPDALNQGRIDALTAWEPTPTIALKQCKNAVIIHQSRSSGYLYFSRSFAQKRPGALRKIVAAQIRAMKWLRANSDNLRTGSRWAIRSGDALAGRKLGLSEAEYVNLARRDLLGMTSYPEITARELSPHGPLARELEFLKEASQIPASVKWEDAITCFDVSIVGEIVQNQQKYKLNVFDYGDSTDDR
ncbi:MAG: ABC transporter substrate-binding protein [Phycisphaerales bacterium]|nr:ABC transporter substrate-binding protein [Phycisphaerales bacterium]